MEDAINYVIPKSDKDSFGTWAIASVESDLVPKPINDMVSSLAAAISRPTLTQSASLPVVSPEKTSFITSTAVSASGQVSSARLHIQSTASTSAMPTQKLASPLASLSDGALVEKMVSLVKSKSPLTSSANSSRSSSADRPSHPVGNTPRSEFPKLPAPKGSMAMFETHPKTAVNPPQTLPQADIDPPRPDPGNTGPFRIPKIKKLKKDNQPSGNAPPALSTFSLNRPSTSGTEPKVSRFAKPKGGNASSYTPVEGRRKSGSKRSRSKSTSSGGELPTQQKQPKKDLAGYEYINDYSGSWIREPSKMLLSKAIMDLRRTMNCPLAIPEDRMYETVLYFSSCLQNFRFSDFGFQHSLSHKRQLPPKPVDTMIPFGENVKLLQLHDYARIFSENNWVTTLVSWLRQAEFFARPRPEQTTRLMFVMLNNDNITHAVRESKKSKDDIPEFHLAAACCLIDMLTWASRQLGIHIIFMGMTVNQTAPASHPAKFLNFFQEELARRRAAGVSQGVYCLDTMTCSFPEPTCLSSGMTIHGYVNKYFQKVFPYLFSYAVNHLDDHPTEAVNEPETAATSDSQV
jgi:hypothetical protein